MKVKFTKERWMNKTNFSRAFWMLLPA